MNIHPDQNFILKPLELRNSSAMLGGRSQVLVYFFDTLASTNQTLWELIRDGANPGTAIVSAQQTAGRGQWGRQWQSSLGGLYFSLFLTPNWPAKDAVQLTLCSVWGIVTALREHQIPAKIKWPNDLMLNHRKLGGILTETKIQGDRITQAVVGVGINWANEVPATGINLQSYLETSGARSSDFSEELLLDIAIQGLVHGCGQLYDQGIEAILPSYLELLTHRGTQVWVDNRPGIVVGVASEGQLRVQLLSGDPRLPSEVLLEPGTIHLGYNS